MSGRRLPSGIIEIAVTILGHQELRHHEKGPRLAQQPWRHLRLLRLQGKKSELGRDQRITLLAGQGFGKLSKWLAQRYGTGSGATI